MVDLQPFEAATNRTAVFCARKGVSTTYPVPYVIWKRKLGGRVESQLSLPDVQSQTVRSNLSAQPVSASPTSPWLVASAPALAVLRRAGGESAYKGFAGACGWLNGVYWVNVTAGPGDLVTIQNLADVGKIKVRSVETQVEPDLLYPLLRGRDVLRWCATPQAAQVIPQDPEERTGFPEAWLEKHQPRLAAYLGGFRRELLGRSGYRKYLAGEPFYSIYNVGQYSFAPVKVVWSEVGHDVDAAVVTSFEMLALGNKVVLPDHSVVAVNVQSEDEGHYLCGMLNSSLSRLIVRGYVALHPSPHILRHLGIVSFDPKNKLHRRLAELSFECHTKAAKGIPVSDLEEQVDEIVASIRQISTREMREIAQSLRTLEPGSKAKESLDDLDHDTD
jgi:hypothetical protein